MSWALIAMTLTSVTQAVAAPTEKCASAEWSSILWPQLASVQFRPTSLEEKAAFDVLVPKLVQAATTQSELPPDLVTLARTIDFRLDAIDVNKEVFWVLRERPGHFRGAGSYVFRTGPATTDVIQAPHEFYDTGTGKLAANLFTCAAANQRPRAFFTNTAHRFRSRPDEKVSDQDHPADVAHNPEHLFQHATDLMARSLEKIRVFQIHGFGKSDVDVRESISAVVSSGSRQPPASMRFVASRLQPVLGGSVRLFPEETELLGATRNAQARLLAAYTDSRFVHIELSRSTRRMLTSSEQVQKFAQSLFAPEEEKP
jgi:hypothetical protein